MRRYSPREHPLEDQYPQITQEDAAVWSNPRSPSTVTNQASSNESEEAAPDGQRLEGLAPIAQPIISTPPIAESDCHFSHTSLSKAEKDT